MRRLVAYIAIALLATLAFAPSAVAAPPEAQTFTAILSGDNEVPARDTSARGFAIFHLSEDGTISYKLIVANIDNVVASHIHIAPAGVNGPVVQFLFGPVPAAGGPSNGVLATGTFTPTPALLAAMSSGNAYVNVHTNDGVAPTNTGPGDFPGGEVRGQIRTNGP